MKATGIVRRIDDLGRVVIPKEIRRTMRIKEGSPLEIFVDREGEVILKKYSMSNGLEEYAQEYADSLHQSLGHITFICDRYNVVAVSGITRKDFLKKSMDPNIRKIIDEQKTISVNDKNDSYFEDITIIEDMEKYKSFSKVVSPIIVKGEGLGAVILMGTDPKIKMDNVDIKIAGTASNFLAKKLETLN